MDYIYNFKIGLNFPRVNYSDYYDNHLSENLCTVHRSKLKY